MWVWLPLRRVHYHVVVRAVGRVRVALSDVGERVRGTWEDQAQGHQLRRVVDVLGVWVVAVDLGGRKGNRVVGGDHDGGAEETLVGKRLQLKRDPELMRFFNRAFSNRIFDRITNGVIS